MIIHFLKVILSPLDTGQFYVGDGISEKAKWEGQPGLCAHRAWQKHDLAPIHTRQQLTTTWLQSPGLSRRYFYPHGCWVRRETSRRRLRRAETVTPAEGQLPSPAWSCCCPGSRPAFGQHLGCGQLPPPRPAPPRLVTPPRRPSPALGPSSPPSVGTTRPSRSRSPRPQQAHRPAQSPPPQPPLPPS